jgi:hypothetical protein
MILVTGSKYTLFFLYPIAGGCFSADKVVNPLYGSLPYLLSLSKTNNNSLSASLYKMGIEIHNYSDKKIKETGRIVEKRNTFAP